MDLSMMDKISWQQASSLAKTKSLSARSSWTFFKWISEELVMTAIGSERIFLMSLIISPKFFAKVGSPHQENVQWSIFSAAGIIFISWMIFEVGTNSFRSFSKWW